MPDLTFNEASFQHMSMGAKPVFTFAGSQNAG